MRTFFRRLFKLVMAAIALALFAFAGTNLWFVATESSAADLPQLKTGDLIFQTTGGIQGLAIFAASHSAYTHMGIVEISHDGSKLVVEAVGPVKSTALDQWINRGIGKRITIKRLDGLSSDDAEKILAAAHRYDGLPYDIFFLPDKDHIYCSELAHLAFKEGANLNLGKVQQVKELYLNNPAAKRLIQQRWQIHPLCRSAENKTFENCYAKILEQELVTPSSVASDPQLTTIFSNFGIAEE